MQTFFVFKQEKQYFCTVILEKLSILNYKNIAEATLELSPKMNCLIGQNGVGKTNVLDAVYYLSFCRSSNNPIDSQVIRHGQDFFMLEGVYEGEIEEEVISCAMKRGMKKHFRRNKKEYKRLSEHIGLITIVMVSPNDTLLIDGSSEERRRFMDVVISQLDRKYLDCLTTYNALLKQRNALLKQYGDAPNPPDDLLEVLEWQMIEPAEYIFAKRTAFFEAFEPYFAKTYAQISGSAEIPQLRYISQLQDRDLREAYVRTRQRDLILGWTSQGIHKDDLEMRLGDYPLKQVGSQGQQRTFVLSMKLAQALYLSYSEAVLQRSDLTASAVLQAEPVRRKPILLLDDIFDRLDSERVERIVEMVQGDDFGQIFITDTDRQHLTEILKPNNNAKIFHVENGTII